MNGHIFKQSKGIAKGYNAAPPLAIIYMHDLEEKLCKRSSSIIFRQRYIDAIFIVYSRNSQDILTLSNKMNPHILFTFEEPKEDKISFLDTTVSYIDHRFYTQLYIKPTHSGKCLPYDAYVPNLARSN